MSKAMLKRAVTLVFLLPLGLGCTNFALTDLLSPSLIDELTNTTNPAALPGLAQVVLVTFENRLNNPVSYEITYRTVNDTIPDPLSATLDAKTQWAEAVACPVIEITVGDITDLTVSGVFVGVGGQTVNDPFVSVEPLGILLREGVNYECGDGVTFVVLESTATASGYRVLAFVESA
jgi:hypothetical protein